MVLLKSFTQFVLGISILRLTARKQIQTTALSNALGAGHVSFLLFSFLVLSAGNHHVRWAWHPLLVPTPHWLYRTPLPLPTKEAHDMLSRWRPHSRKREWHTLPHVCPALCWQYWLHPEALHDSRLKTTSTGGLAPFRVKRSLWDETGNPVPERALHSSPTSFFPGSQILMQMFVRVTAKGFPL